jgi:hypothetical protein
VTRDNQVRLGSKDPRDLRVPEAKQGQLVHQEAQVQMETLEWQEHRDRMER